MTEPVAEPSFEETYAKTKEAILQNFRSVEGILLEIMDKDLRDDSVRQKYVNTLVFAMDKVQGEQGNLLWELNKHPGDTRIMKLLEEVSGFQSSMISLAGGLVHNPITHGELQVYLKEFRDPIDAVVAA